jgi:hypothetical protein
VGSWARGDPGPTSDLDLVVLTEMPEAYVGRDDWIAALGGARVVRTMAWGAVTERRLLTSSGLELDVGIAVPAWADTAPVDAGTRSVVGRGIAVLYDPRELLTQLRLACSA